MAAKVLGVGELLLLVHCLEVLPQQQILSGHLLRRIWEEEICLISMKEKAIMQHCVASCNCYCMFVHPLTLKIVLSIV